MTTQASSPENRKLARLGIAADHGGFELKEKLAVRLHAAGYEVVDFGAHQMMPEDDYPDFVIPLSKALANGTVERGIAVYGSGVGASVCANKINGVRACLIEDHFSAKQGVEDDHLNLICFGGRIQGLELVWDLIQAFLSAEFSQAPRHLRRLNRVNALENASLFGTDPTAFEIPDRCRVTFVRRAGRWSPMRAYTGLKRG